MAVSLILGVNLLSLEGPVNSALNNCMPPTPNTIDAPNGQTDAATKHCIAASVERPLGFDRHITPLYRQAPKYPSSAENIRKEGMVIAEFIIDEEGFTKEIKIIESSSSTFHKPSIEAIEKFRYAPSIKDGQRLETKGVRIKMVYYIR